MPCGTEAAYLPSDEVTQTYGRWQPPDEAKAFTRHRAEHLHHDCFDLWSARVRDFKEFGVGHMMYFHFLWWMAALFSALALLVAAPNMAINLAGKYYEVGQLELTTLGNFGRVAVSHSNDGPSSYTPTATGWMHENGIAQAFMADAAQPPATAPINKAAAVVAASAIDCAGAAIYFLVALGLILLARRRAEDADVHTVTIHDYSVYVTRLPGDAGAEELAEFFGQWGEVENVEVVRAYGSLLRLVLARGALLLRLQWLVAGLRKAAQEHPQVPASMEHACHSAREDVEEADYQIKIEEAQGDTRRVVGAFVTFRNEAARLACLQATPRSWIRRLWALKAKHKLRGCHALLVEEAPEPSDVKYENMEHGWADRAARAALVAVCSYTALGLGFLLISLATAAQVNLAMAAGINEAQCSSSCRLSVDGAVGLTDADRTLYAACADTGSTPTGDACSAAEKICYRCYCFTALTSGMLSESSYCSSALEMLALQYSGQVGVILAILGINMLLAATSRLLTRFEKHHTRSSEARSLAHKLFLAQFLNSAVSTIVANAHLPFLANLLNGSVFEGIFFQGIYTDLTPNWYKVVGRSLLISQFVAAVLRMVYLLMRRLTVAWNHWRRRTCLTQEELDSSLKGPEFELDHRYGEHLSVIYVSLLLSSGMPIALMSAAFWFISAYWCDKYELLALSRRPVIYGSDLSNHVMGLLPYAAVWHLLLGVWAFSLFGVSQSRLVTQPFAALVSTVCNGMSSVWEAATGISAEQAARRLLGADAAHLLVMLFVLAGVLFLKLTLTVWISAGRWLLNMSGLLPDAEDTQGTGAPEFPVAVRTQLLVGQTSYAIQDQPAYATAFTRAEDGPEADAQVQVVLRGAQGRKHHSSTGNADSTLGAAHLAQAAASPRAQSLLLDDALLQRGPVLQLGPQHAEGGVAPLAATAQPPGRLSRASSSSSSRGSSRGSSRRSSRSSGHTSDAGGAGEAGQQLQLQHGAGPESYPAMPALGEQRVGNAGGRASGSRPGSGSDRRTPSSAAQRFRQARANQVVPIPEHYLVHRYNEGQE